MNLLPTIILDHKDFKPFIDLFKEKSQDKREMLIQDIHVRKHPQTGANEVQLVLLPVEPQK